MQPIKEVILKSMGDKVIRYFLLVDHNDGGKTMYGICILEEINGTSLKEKIEGISENKDFVLELINYLSENVIDTAHFKDIVEDYNVFSN